jgi:hypothetical protein
LFNGKSANLGHDYQYDFDTPYAQQALAKVLEFLKMRSQVVIERLICIRGITTMCIIILLA